LVKGPFNHFGKLARMISSTRAAKLAFAGLLFLTGCVDYEEEMWLNTDFSGRAAITVSVREELVQGNTGLERDMSEEKIRRDLERIPGVKLEAFKSFRDAGKRIAKLTIAFDSIEKITRHETSVAESSAVSFLGAITIERASGKVVLQRVLPVLPEARSQSWGADLLMQGLGSLLLSNNYLTYKLHVPGEIITANTQRIDGDSRIVQWKFSLAQALREPPAMKVEWRADTWTWWIVGIMLVTAVAAAGLILKRRRKAHLL
jgi:hypothetical protein